MPSMGFEATIPAFERPKTVTAVHSEKRTIHIDSVGETLRYLTLKHMVHMVTIAL
jgi:hypothetical protein